MIKDYRCSAFCPEFVDIPLKKKALEKKIQAESGYRNMYNAIRNRRLRYNAAFRLLYNSKCSYCGVDIDNQSYLLFEIDHFLCRKHPGSDESPDRIENLMLACYVCNRKKSNFQICLENGPCSEKSYTELLNPDYKHITGVFIRDSHYRIIIAPEFSSDEHIKTLHKQMMFDSPIRQLDYLLLELKGLINGCSDPDIELRLRRVKDALISARNHGKCCS